jgi:hypothetical protein
MIVHNIITMGCAGSVPNGIGKKKKTKNFNLADCLDSVEMIKHHDRNRYRAYRPRTPHPLIPFEQPNQDNPTSTMCLEDDEEGSEPFPDAPNTSSNIAIDSSLYKRNTSALCISVHQRSPDDVAP